MKHYGKTSTPPNFTFLSQMFSPHFLKTSSKGTFSYLNMLSPPLVKKHFFKKKLFLTFPILNNFALLKRTPSLPNYRYSPNSPLTKSFCFKISLYIQEMKNKFESTFFIFEFDSKFHFSKLSFSFFKDEILPFLATSDNHHHFLLAP